MRATELLRNRFGVSQLYKYEVKEGDEVVLEVFWHPLTIDERESIQKKVDAGEGNDFALGLMIEKALDENPVDEPKLSAMKKHKLWLKDKITNIEKDQELTNTF